MKNKLILDFDGIFAADMLYDTKGKALKSFPWGIRHSIDILTDNGFEIYIITGDSTKFGQDISARFTKNLKIEEIIFVHSQDKLTTLRNRFNLDECIYAGDDIYDIEIFKQCYGIIPKDGHTIFNDFVDYRSINTTRDYFFMDMAMHIMKEFVYGYPNTDEESINKLGEYIVKESGHQNLNKLLLDLRYQHVFILQQYSMRNHTDGLYNPLLDGNLNLTLHRIYTAMKANPNMTVTITIPMNVDDAQFKLLKSFTHLYFNNNVTFEKIKYGKNALENRKHFNQTDNLSELTINADLIITDFELSNFKSYKPVIYNFNISKINDLSRWYVDEFFDKQFQQVIESSEYVYVLNSNQKEFMINHTETIQDKQIVKSNVIIDTEIINKELFEFQYNFFTNQLDTYMKTIIEEVIQLHIKTNDHVYFIPFRLTDECYQFKTILKLLGGSNKKCAVLVTNPNDGLIINDIPENVSIINIANTFEHVNKKSLYYYILNVISKHDSVRIPIFENPEIVLHQSLIEMSILAPNQVNFIHDSKTPTFETLNKNMNNTYIQNLIY
jgi:3-deoxy-D-manno-octulosonate 8-phosphate phosphatase KdsC-like HAD superfamily phosphatase